MSSAIRDAGFADDVLRVCLVSAHGDGNVDGDVDGDGNVSGDSDPSHITCCGSHVHAATMEEIRSAPVRVPIVAPYNVANLLFQLQGDAWW